MMNHLFSNLNSARGHKKAPGRARSLGQSLVELALTMPVLLLIVAGTVEVTNLITLYNTLQLATREGTRLAAQGAPDATVHAVIAQSLAKTAVVSYISDAPGHTVKPPLNVWIIRPALNVTTGPLDWKWTGGSKTTWGVPEKCITLWPDDQSVACDGASPVTANMVGTQLWKTPNDSLKDETLVVVVSRYQAQTLLNLSYWGSSTGRIPVYTYTVFRQEVSNMTASQLSSGCSVYPIAISSRAIPVEIASEGYKIPVSVNNLTDGFSFLAWNGSSNSATALATAITTPGTSQKDIPASNTTGYYINPYSLNIQVRRGSWVLRSSVTTVSSANVTTLNAHRDTKRALRVMLYDPGTSFETSEVPDVTELAGNPVQDLRSSAAGGIQYTVTGGDPNKWVFQVANFIIVRVSDATNANTTGLVTFEFVKQDASCGYAQ